MSRVPLNVRALRVVTNVNNPITYADCRKHRMTAFLSSSLLFSFYFCLSQVCMLIIIMETNHPLVNAARPTVKIMQFFRYATPSRVCCARYYATTLLQRFSIDQLYSHATQHPWFFIQFYARFFINYT